MLVGKADGDPGKRWIRGASIPTTLYLG